MHTFSFRFFKKCKSLVSFFFITPHMCRKETNFVKRFNSLSIDLTYFAFRESNVLAQACFSPKNFRIESIDTG